jgi:hypothetical protein
MWTFGQTVSAIYIHRDGYDDRGLRYVMPQQTFIDDMGKFMSLTLVSKECPVCPMSNVQHS